MGHQGPEPLRRRRERRDSAPLLCRGELLVQDDLPNNEFTTRFYDDGRVIESQVPENREQSHYIVRLGSDWSVTDASAVSVSGIYDFETHTDRAQVPFILASTGERERFWFWREKEDTGFANISFDWKRQFGTPGHELGVNLQYTRGWEDEAYFLNEVSRVREGTDMTHLQAEENTLPLSIDYVRPLRAGRLELGTRLQRRWLPITYTVGRGAQSVIYEGLGDASNWNESIVALYGNLVREQGSYSLEAGVRIEQTGVSYIIPTENIYYTGSDRYDYFEVFPNVRLTYRLNSANRLVAAYNRRIDRPGEPELRIFPKYDDPELLKVGNPFLRPQLTDAVEIGFGHSWDGGSASAALYHRDIEDSFFRALLSTTRTRTTMSSIGFLRTPEIPPTPVWKFSWSTRSATHGRCPAASIGSRTRSTLSRRRCSFPRGVRSPWPPRRTTHGT